MDNRKKLSSRMMTRAVAFIMAFAMIATSVGIIPTTADAAKKKVSSVKITKPSTKVLVLKKGKTYKIKPTVTASKKSYKKVTYKSSKAKIVKVSASGKIKALKKGTAKITVTSKTDKKKKATLTIKVGTPITGVTLSGKVGRTEYYIKDVTNVETGVVSQKKYYRTVYEPGAFSKKKAATVNLQANYFIELKANFAPSKATYRKVTYTTSDKKIATVNAVGIITARKVGTATITATTADGSNKKATVKINVSEAAPAVTEVPEYENETRTGVKFEDFENYEVGYNWETEKGATKGKDFADKNCGTMTVVQDPENPANKCLKITYNGDTQAYDYAPIFNVTLGVGKTMENYSGIRLKSRVVSAVADCRYKAISVYFDQYQKITSDNYFMTTWTKPSDATEEDVRLHKFLVDIPMAYGVSKKYNIPGDETNTKTYNNKYFPMYYDAWGTEKIERNRTVGYKETDADAAVGWHTNNLSFDTTRIKAADDKLMSQRKFDMAIGSTYAGAAVSGGITTVYVDDIEFLEGDILLTALDIAPKHSSTIAEGFCVNMEATFTPENSTQKELSWTSSDAAVATVDAEGKVVGVSAGTATITGTCKANPAFSKSVVITVVPKGTAAVADYIVDLSTYTAKKAESETDPYLAQYGSDVQCTAAEEGIIIPFEKNNQFVVIKLPQPMDLTSYKGLSITGDCGYQLAMEFHDSNFDQRYSTGSTDENEAFKAFDWWLHYDWATYPFFDGSTIGRDEDGTPGKKEDGSLNPGVETLNYVWYSPDKSFPSGTDNTLRGSLTNVQYIVLKSNQYKADRTINIKSIKFLAETPTKRFENP